eukprot:1964-Eustigmatos_ZCMA.PRE.1
MVDFVPALAESIPGAKFVDIVRHPKDSFVSWFGLQEVRTPTIVQLLCMHRPVQDEQRVYVSLFYL